MKLLVIIFVVQVLVLESVEGQVTCQADVAILVDQSGSITDVGGMSAWYEMTNFTKDIIDSFVTDTVDSHVALVSFGNRARLFGNLVRDKTMLLENLNTLRDAYEKQFTNTSAAFYLALNEIFTGLGDETGGDRPNVPNVIIVITDGEPTFGLNGKTDTNTLPTVLYQEVSDLATQHKNKGVVIITVAVNIQKQAALDLLQGISTDNNFISTMNFTTLRQELQRIVDQTCKAIPVILPCRESADIYFVLDSSGSIKEKDFNNIKQFVARVIHQLPLGQGAKVGVLYFSAGDFVGFNLDRYTDIYEAGNATVAIPYLRSRTDTTSVLRYLWQSGFTAGQGDQSGAPNIGVIFTDGNSNDQREQTLSEALKVKMSGIHLISVGIGDWYNPYELQGLASDPYTSNYIHVLNTDTMLANNVLRDQMKALLCNDVNECSSVTCQCSGTCMDKIGAFTCLCPGTCAGQLCETNCAKRMDAIFAVDASSSMMAIDFRTELDFVRSLMIAINMNNGDKVGFESFSLPQNGQAISSLFELNTFGNLAEALNGLTLHYMGGSTNTYDAISNIVNNMYTSANGDTANVNVLVILTDGRSMSYTDTWTQAKRAREAGITVIVVAIGNRFSDRTNRDNYQNIMELQAMASGEGNTNVFYVNSFTDLPQAVRNVADAMCNNVGECENINCMNGGTPVDSIGYCTCMCPVASGSQPSFAGEFCERRGTDQMDIILLIDSSGSIRNTRFVDVLIFLMEFVKNFPVHSNRARFGAVYFSDSATVAFELNTYSLMEDILLHLRSRIPFLGGQTNIADALALVPTMINNGGRSGVPKLVVLLTDGASNIKAESTIPNAISVRENIAPILVLGIGTQTNNLELRGMASSPKSVYMMMAESFTSITTDAVLRAQKITDMVSAGTDNVNECDSSPCNLANTLSCFNDYHKYVCTCSTQTSGRTCSRTCPVQLDVALVLDFSGSLDVVYDTVIAFAEEMVYGLPAPNDVRIAVIQYSTNAVTRFNLDKYVQNKDSILNALSFNNLGGRTNTPEALLKLTTEVFVSNNGDRPAAKNVAVVVTDGGSNDRTLTETRAADARSAGIELFVGAFGNVWMPEVNAIASNPDSEHVFVINSSNDVASVASRMLDKLCTL